MAIPNHWSQFTSLQSVKVCDFIGEGKVVFGKEKNMKIAEKADILGLLQTSKIIFQGSFKFRRQ